MIDHLEPALRLRAPGRVRAVQRAVDLRVSEVVDVPYPLVSALLRLDIFE